MIWVLAARGVRPTTRSVLAFEVVSVCLILVLMGAIFWRLAAGTAPGGQTLSGDVFVLPSGVGVSTLALAAVAGSSRSLALSRRARWVRSPWCRRG